MPPQWATLLWHSNSATEAPTSTTTAAREALNSLPMTSRKSGDESADREQAIGPAFGQAGFSERQAPEQISIAIDRFHAEAERTLAGLDSVPEPYSVLE